MRASREWSEDEVQQLRTLYQEFKDSVDPVNRILERMEVKRQKKRVVEKIMGQLLLRTIECTHQRPFLHNHQKRK
jgi:hypothetical protein